MYAHGWYHIAFESELKSDITPLEFGKTQLMAVKTGDRIRVTDAACPHRGAHLGYGGRVDGDSILCPFHGYRIGIGTDVHNGLAVREHETLVRGGMVFVRLSDEETTDLPAALDEIEKDHDFVNGFKLNVSTTIEMVMENGFDNGHFKVVHGLLNEPGFTVGESAEGALQVEGDFQIPRSSWNADPRSGRPVHAHYRARAFSPGVVIAELQGEEPFNYKILTAAVPNADLVTSSVRLNLALPKGADGSPASKEFAEALLESSQAGIKMDCAIWDHLILDNKDQLSEADKAVIEFGKFCALFRSPQAEDHSSRPAV